MRERMLWPAKGRPELRQQGKVWIVRWYNPVEKRCRAYRTECELSARLFLSYVKEPTDSTP